MPWYNVEKWHETKSGEGIHIHFNDSDDHKPYHIIEIWKDSKSGKWREQMEKAILNIPLNISALLGEPVMSVGNMTRLKSGDVVPIRIHDGVTIKIEDKPFFTGEIGEVAGKSAISLQKRM